MPGFASAELQANVGLGQQKYLDKSTGQNKKSTQDSQACLNSREWSRWHRVITLITLLVLLLPFIYTNILYWNLGETYFRSIRCSHQLNSQDTYHDILHGKVLYRYCKVLYHNLAHSIILKCKHHIIYRFRKYCNVSHHKVSYRKVLDRIRLHYNYTNLPTCLCFPSVVC